MRTLSLALAASVLAGCTGTDMFNGSVVGGPQNGPGQIIGSPSGAFNADAAFHPGDVAWSFRTGNNVIRGSALLDASATCAGQRVSLVPRSAYADARFMRIYGNLVEGHVDTVVTSGGLFSGLFDKTASGGPADPGYTQTIRTTACDSGGYFEFGGIPDGSYFVSVHVKFADAPVTYVGLGTDSGPQRGTSLMQRVDVSGGHVRSIVLTPPPAGIRAGVFGPSGPVGY